MSYNYYISVDEPLIPLEDVAIPQEYLFPEFRQRKVKKLEEIDIFSFGTRNVTKRFHDRVRAHIRDCPESIAPVQPGRFAKLVIATS